MNRNILRIISLLLLIVLFSSCFEGRWAKYHKRYHYGSRKHYAKWHARGNRDW